MNVVQFLVLDRLLLSISETADLHSHLFTAFTENNLAKRNYPVRGMFFEARGQRTMAGLL